MLDVALTFLVKSLNSYMVFQTGSSFGEAELGRVIDENGKCAIKPDHLGVSMLNVEEERVFRAQLPDVTNENGRLVKHQPPLKLNLFVIVAANFQQYDQGLRHLALVLTFFQANPVFLQSANPALDARIEKLSLELQSLSFEQLNQVWAFLGGKHVPSAIYKVRMVTVQDRAPTGVEMPVMTLGLTTRGL